MRVRGRQDLCAEQDQCRLCRSGRADVQEHSARHPGLSAGRLPTRMRPGRAQGRDPGLRTTCGPAAQLRRHALAPIGSGFCAAIFGLPGHRPSGRLGRHRTPVRSAAVPLVTDRVRSTLADYARQPDFKAVAISRLGWAHRAGFPNSVGAERDALDRCRKQDPKGDCRIYAVGDKVVWPQTPLPLPADLHSVPLDIPLAPADISIVKGMPSAAGLDAFLKKNNHKALAVGERESTIDNRSDAAEANSAGGRALLRFCQVALFAGVRRWLSDGASSPFPRRCETLHLAGDADMSDADGSASDAIYGGKDWRRGEGVGAGMRSAPRTPRRRRPIRPWPAAARPRRSVELRAIGNFRIDKR